MTPNSVSTPPSSPQAHNSTPLSLSRESSPAASPKSHPGSQAPSLAGMGSDQGGFLPPDIPNTPADLEPKNPEFLKGIFKTLLGGVGKGGIVSLGLGFFLKKVKLRDPVDAYQCNQDFINNVKKAKEKNALSRNLDAIGSSGFAAYCSVGAIEWLAPLAKWNLNLGPTQAILGPIAGGLQTLCMISNLRRASRLYELNKKDFELKQAGETSNDKINLDFLFQHQPELMKDITETLLEKHGYNKDTNKDTSRPNLKEFLSNLFNRAETKANNLLHYKIQSLCFEQILGSITNGLFAIGAVLVASNPPIGGAAFLIGFLSLCFSPMLTALSKQQTPWFVHKELKITTDQENAI